MRNAKRKSAIDVSVNRAASEKKEYVLHLSLENKVALATGAASVMGLTTAETFAAEGAAVELVDLNEAAVRKAAERLVAAGHKAIAIACDVTDEAQARGWSNKPSPHSGAWMPRSTMAACRVSLWKPPMRPVKSSIA
jgi:hypothetical protein